MSEVRAKVIDILATQALLDPSEVTDEATVDSLGLDSLGLVEAVFAIEEAFDVHVPFNPSEPGASSFDISSVASIVAAVEGLVAGKAA
ncbi:phosphopantetheine-binding protein [Rhodobacter sp. Har01]|uniref:acyl carrier protein n=1 Tax=Rhodobacter sp. Har01 TaxID=2883999 RepID=UPI001D098966|nr:phosphopantetheine-binding protein [Rhodobacter sp. Har01]MCB6177046.1 phosphopantetheine-binding protein [Rhodobacter sp. Har01]